MNRIKGRIITMFITCTTLVTGCGSKTVNVEKAIKKAVKGAYASQSYEEFYKNKEDAKTVLNEDVVEQLYTINNAEMDFSDTVKVDVSRSQARYNSANADCYIARVKVVNISGEYEMVLRFSVDGDNKVNAMTSTVKSAYNKLTDSTESDS